jgi:small neutral amino acid transporter SnatA (MarC family)
MPISDRIGYSTVDFQLSYGDIGILFFLTLGPLKAILPFARVTRGTEPAFRQTVAWRAIAIATAIVLGVALLGPFVLTNWHVSPPAILITSGIILLYQALRIIMQTPAGAPGSTADRVTSPSQPSLAIAVFPLAIPAIVTAPGIAAIAAIIVINRHDLVHQAIEPAAAHSRARPFEPPCGRAFGAGVPRSDQLRSRPADRDCAAPR